MLPTHAGNLGTAAEVIVADQALDLIAVSFAKAMQSKPRPVACFGEPSRCG
jgi:hypothetical protein